MYVLTKSLDYEQDVTQGEWSSFIGKVTMIDWLFVCLMAYQPLQVI